MEYYPVLKRNAKQAMEKHDWILNAHFQVKETSMKMLQTIWSYLYDILEKAEL